MASGTATWLAPCWRLSFLVTMATFTPGSHHSPATTRRDVDSSVDSLIITLAREPQLFANCSGSAPVRAARLSHAARPVSQLIGYLGCWASLDSALPVAVSALASDLFTGRGGGNGGGDRGGEVVVEAAVALVRLGLG